MNKGWNNIISAPKDGTIMLLHNPDNWRRPIRGYWDARISDWSAEYRELTLGSGKIPDPTHWLPITPPPPATG